MVGGMGLVRREIIIHLRSLSLLLGQNPNLPTKIQKNLKNLRNTHPRGARKTKSWALNWLRDTGSFHPVYHSQKQRATQPWEFKTSGLTWK